MGDDRFAGGWYVDDRCTNCDVARQLAPGLIGEVDGRSAILRRPRDPAEVRLLPSLADRYEALGPVTDVLLTHRDHAAHGRQYADRFGARLWIHERDLDAAPAADHVLRGTDPAEIAAGVTAVPFPGHTQGSVLFLADERYCFSGDSLYWSRTTADVEVYDTVCWYSIRELAGSLGRVAGRLRFEWLLPGHGDRRRLPAGDMARRLDRLTARTRELAPRPVDISAVRW